MLSYASHPDPPMSPPMSPLYRVNFSPQKIKRPEHTRHGSEIIQRPRPMSMMQQSPSKRSSVYVSEASVLLSRRNSVVSPVSPYYESLLSPSSTSNAETPDFVDYYASLELDSSASADQIKAAYRRLRMVYFQSNAIKYRALCAAFDVLADPEAREEYDSTYPANLVSSPRSSLGAVLEQPKHGRKDSGQHSSSIDDVEMATMQEEMAPVQEEEELEETRDEHDLNWGLKRHRRVQEPLIGTEPYPSFVPILELYEGRICHPTLQCSRPTYTGYIATNARPN